jgi:hypothetical protein
MFGIFGFEMAARLGQTMLKAQHDNATEGAAGLEGEMRTASAASFEIPLIVHHIVSAGRLFYQNGSRLSDC